jgi:hypothetical protein
MHEVEPSGTIRKNRHLPGETLPLRGERESAEAVVVMIVGENRQERRAEEPKSKAREGTGRTILKTRSRQFFFFLRAWRVRSGETAVRLKGWS